MALDGDDYQLWDEDGFAWDWVAGQLNLTITGDYVPPVIADIVIENENI